MIQETCFVYKYNVSHCLFFTFSKIFSTITSISEGKCYEHTCFFMDQECVILGCETNSWKNSYVFT